MFRKIALLSPAVAAFESACSKELASFKCPSGQLKLIYKDLTSNAGDSDASEECVMAKQCIQVAIDMEARGRPLAATRKQLYKALSNRLTKLVEQDGDAEPSSEAQKSRLAVAQKVKEIQTNYCKAIAMSDLVSNSIREMTAEEASDCPPEVVDEVKRRSSLDYTQKLWLGLSRGLQRLVEEAKGKLPSFKRQKQRMQIEESVKKLHRNYCEALQNVLENDSSRVTTEEEAEQCPENVMSEVKSSRNVNSHDGANRVTD